MSAAATLWITVRKKGDATTVYVAHPVGNGWRFAERTDERFPVWHLLTEEEFWQQYERCHS